MKKLFAVFLSLVFITSLFSPIGAAATEKNNITVTLDENGVLTISGTGEVRDLLCYGNTYGWGNTNGSEKIKHVVIEEGITGIYDSFMYVRYLRTVSFPETLKVISNSFVRCMCLHNLVFPKSLERIEKGCFQTGNVSLKKIEFNSPVEIIGTPEAMNFIGINGLEEIVFKEGTRIEYSFSYIPDVKEVYIPNDCYLKSSFIKVSKLKKVSLGKNVYIEPQRYADIVTQGPSFTNCHENLIVYVDEITENHEQALPWQEFRIIGSEKDARLKKTSTLVWIVVGVSLYTIVLFLVLIFIKKKTRV